MDVLSVFGLVDNAPHLIYPIGVGDYLSQNRIYSHKIFCSIRFHFLYVMFSASFPVIATEFIFIFQNKTTQRIDTKC